jgi:hypothetical protein
VFTEFFLPSRGVKKIHGGWDENSSNLHALFGLDHLRAWPELFKVWCGAYSYTSPTQSFFFLIIYFMNVHIFF